nr:guanine nucleotide-binding protein subunit alpha-12-like [Misgurnus anguillicaudatus]
MSKRLRWSFLPTVSDLKQKRAARRRSREIDVMLKRTSQVPVKILLAGECQSGKSTFLKQMRIINGPEFSQQELIDFRRTVYQNIIQGLQLLVREKNKMGIPWENSANENNMLVTLFVSWDVNLEPDTFQGFVTAINSLWNDSGIQEACSTTKSIKDVTYESLKYFLNNMNRIGQLSYIPSKQDILYARKSWNDRCGYFEHRNVLIMRSDLMRKFRYYDQSVIIFMAASSEFDQVMDDFYSSDENNLVQSLRLFKVVLCNRFLRKCTTIILFLNKTDLLAEKVKTADIRKNFPEFQGDPHSLEDVQRFQVECYKEKIASVDGSHPFFYHFTTALDTENIRIAFESVKEIIMQKNLKKVKIL